MSAVEKAWVPDAPGERTYTTPCERGQGDARTERPSTAHARTCGGAALSCDGKGIARTLPRAAAPSPAALAASPNEIGPAPDAVEASVGRDARRPVRGTSADVACWRSGDAVEASAAARGALPKVMLFRLPLSCRGRRAAALTAAACCCSGSAGGTASEGSEGGLVTRAEAAASAASATPPTDPPPWDADADDESSEESGRSRDRPAASGAMTMSSSVTVPAVEGRGGAAAATRIGSAEKPSLPPLPDAHRWW